MSDNIISFPTRPTVADKFRYLDRDFEFSWAPATEHVGRIVEESGDIILQLHDLWDVERIRRRESVDSLGAQERFGEFIDLRVLERWADGWSFNLDDIDPAEALYFMMHAFLLPSIAELPDGGMLCAAVKDARRPEDPRRVELAHTLRVDGALVRQFLTDIYDGPFASDADLRTAILRRSR